MKTGVVEWGYNVWGKYIMEDNGIYLIVSLIMLVVTELLPFLPTKSQGLIHMFAMVAEDRYEMYKSKKNSQPK